MKKIRNLILFALMTLIVYACGKDDDGPAVACFDYETEEGVATLNAGCSENAATYFWIVDNVQYEEQTVTHEFSSSGSYEVVLVVSSNDGSSDQTMGVVVIEITSSSGNEDCVECKCSEAFTGFPNANSPYNSCNYHQDPSLFETTFSFGCSQSGGEVTCE